MRTTEIRCVAFAAAFCGLMLAVTPSPAMAQDETEPVAWDVARSVLIDPTTYAPAVLSYEAQRLDWKTSQVFLDRGWLEQNPRFTISGRSNDVAISYEAGTRRIRKDALERLQWSITHNLAVGICERLLAARYPRHRKLLHALSWMERISMASYVSYLGSIEHVRQAGRNRRLAQANGYAE